jgi:hypothetical protein
MKLVPFAADTPVLRRFATPVLHHSDLHMGNIFVAEDDATAIVSVIDWQFVSVMPRFMQVRWPVFIEPPDGYVTGAVRPRLPPNYDEMDAEDRELAKAKYDDELLAKCYEVALVKKHRESHSALTGVDTALRRLFTGCEATYRNGIISLRDSVMRLAQTFGAQGVSPVTFAPDEVAEHAQELERYDKWCTLRDYTRQLLGFDDEGWVSEERDFEEVQAKHRELYELYMRNQEPGQSLEKARSEWFYIERE